uniref:Molybdopterin-guanine dinucleotide biosynthesis protein B n=1 Tax=Caldimicrobium thiodismutans TaxID=1653476 RepID=A0A832GMI7_9BACT
MPLILSLSGYHNSGKTTLGTYLVSELVKRGFKVAVVKATKEEVLLTDKEGSDTWRYRKAGAEAVALLQSQLLTLYFSHFPQNKEDFLDFLEALFPHYHLLLLEGFKGWSNIPKIWLLKEGEDPSEIRKKFGQVELILKPEEREKALNYLLEKLGAVKGCSPQVF